MRLSRLFAPAVVAMMASPAYAENVSVIGDYTVVTGDTGVGNGGDGETVTLDNPSLPENQANGVIAIGGQGGSIRTVGGTPGNGGDVVINGTATITGDDANENFNALITGGQAGSSRNPGSQHEAQGGNVSDINAEIYGTMNDVYIKVLGGAGYYDQASGGGDTGKLQVTVKADAIINELSVISSGGKSDLGQNGATGDTNITVENGAVVSNLTFGFSRTIGQGTEGAYVPGNVSVTMLEGSNIENIVNKNTQPATVRLMQELASEEEYVRTSADLLTAQGYVVIDGIPLSWQGKIAFENLMTYARLNPTVPVDVIVTNPGSGNGGTVQENVRGSGSDQSSTNFGTTAQSVRSSSQAVITLPVCNNNNIYAVQQGNDFVLGTKIGGSLTAFGKVSGTTFRAYGTDGAENTVVKVGARDGYLTAAIIPGGSCKLRLLPN